MSARLDELERLIAAATEGPWKSMRDGNQFIQTQYFPSAKCVGASRLSGVARPWNPHALIAFGFTPKEYETVRLLDSDADMVAALRNAAPALLKLWRAGQEISDGLKSDGSIEDAVERLRSALAALDGTPEGGGK